MRVATRIGAGSALLAVVVVGVVGYELVLLRRMADAGRDLSTVTFQSALLTVEQLRTIDELEEHASKLAVTGDPAYGQRVDELRSAFVANLTALERLPLSDAERIEVERLGSLWDVHPLSSATGPQIAASLHADGETGLVWVDRFASLRAQADRVLATAEATIAARIEASTEEARRATRLAWSVGAGALGLTLLLGFLLVRSITRPLKRLSDGTRAIAAGELTHYVPLIGDDEFAEVTERFNLMTERLAELDRVKKELLSRVSHDLKTPLATMIETTRLLRDQVSGPINAKQQRLLELTLESGERLTGMISKLLDLSRLEASTATYIRQEVDLAALVQGVMTRFEGAARERAVTFAVHGLEAAVPLRCDRDRMTSVIENLVENALKFAPSDTTVEIGLHTGADMQDHQPPSWQQGASFLPTQVVMLTVADRGPGVPDRQKGRIFQKFQQGETRPNVGRAGIGLGLAICREVVEAHDGAIWVEDHAGGGSVFYLMLPIHTPPAAATASGGRASITAVSMLLAATLLTSGCARTVLEADELFTQGRDVEAVAAYEQLLSTGSLDPEQRARASYRLALLLDSPGSAHDPARATALLEALAQSGSGAPYATEARLLMATRARLLEVQASLDAERDARQTAQATVAGLEANLEAAQLDADNRQDEVTALQARVRRLQAEIGRRDARVAQLEEELERLKQIDLRQRPRE